MSPEELDLWIGLKTAAREVIANWEQGDLASAVQWLSQALDDLRDYENPCSICGVSQADHNGAKCREEYEEG